MFTWFWEFCFMITETFFKLIDLVTASCNKISGIDTITVSGQDTTMLTFLFASKNVTVAFIICAVCGAIFTIFFTIIQIVINFSKEKTDETPITIVKKGVKAIFIAMLVPLFIYLFFVLGNAFTRVMYQATGATSKSISQYMFYIFSQQGWKAGTVMEDFGESGACQYYASFDTIESYIEISEFDFVYSWIIGGIVVWALFSTALKLVERVFSLFLLYIISPAVIATSVMDDGAKFKAWREQVLIKFFSGFGAILGINVYLMIVQLVTAEEVIFFHESVMIFPAGVLNEFLKLVFVAGGAVCLKQVQAIVGNIISNGAGDKMMAEGERANTGFMSGLGKPFRAGRAIANFANDAKSKNYGFSNAVAQRLGIKTKYDYMRDYAIKTRNAEANGGPSNNYNGNIPNMNVNANINGQNNQQQQQNNQQNNDNGNRANLANQGQGMVNSVIANAGGIR